MAADFGTRRAGSGWSVADVALLDELADLVGAPATLGAGTGTTSIEADTFAARAAQDRTWAFGHVIVDEGQELSAMQWRALRRRCPTLSFTVVGDVNQTSSPGGTTSWADALDDGFGDRWRQVDLTVCYRTPREVMEARLEELNPGFAQRVRTGEIRPDGDVTLPEADVASFVLATCRRCGADTLKPDVVYFGENVPKDRVARAYEAVDDSQLLLVLGSSLQVMSGYRFVRHSHKAGRPVAIITRGRTRGDAEATHRIDAGLGESLVALARLLGLTEDFGEVVDGEYATGLPLGLT